MARRHGAASYFSILNLPFSLFVLSAFCLLPLAARGEAMLELFQMTWPQVTQKMPELAEAGYDSLWLPVPGKGNEGGYSVGYDCFDPFDLGSTNQQGSVATKYGTQAQLIQMVQTAHQFGIRIYFDNVMNHRATTVPGYPNSGTPTNYYPGLIPQDFHMQTVSGGWNNWPDVGSGGQGDWCMTPVVQNQPLLGLCDIANEPGTLNYNYGNNDGNTITKPSWVRFPGRPDLYMDTNGPSLGSATGSAWPNPPNGYGPVNGWRPFDGHGQPVAEDASTYLCRAVAWTLYMTKCDGFRLDAVKHVPVSFFGNETGQTDDPNFGGYTGAIQAMYDWVHGYGNNVTGNGYVETDGSRNSLFNTESPRNDAMIFGEFEPGGFSTSSGQAYVDYLNSGMRLLNQPLYAHMNNALYNQNGATMQGLNGRDYAAPTSDTGTCDNSPNFSSAQAVNFPQTQDNGSCCPANQGFEDAYFFLREGLPMVYSDGYNHNTGPSGTTPIVSYANYLGEFGDDSIPEILRLHNNLSRGGTWARWSLSDPNIIAFERYDYREGDGSNPASQDVALVLLDHNNNAIGDETFDDGVNQTYDGYYGGLPISNSKGQGLAVGFAPGSVIVQLAGTSPTGGRAYQKLLVHAATTSYSAAQADSSRTNLDPVQRLIYVGNQTIPTGGGAIELNIPNNSWLIYGYQWPEPSRANHSTNAIILRQNGVEVPHVTIQRTDGINGDTNYNPYFPFKMRGGVDQYGNVIGGVHVSNLTYSIDVPIVTNGAFDIIVRSDASTGSGTTNTMVKLDGGMDLNSQMGLGPTNLNGKSSDGLAPTNFLDLRDNKPGYADDRFCGYEQTAFQFCNGPEKFAARNVLSNNIVSLGAETYYYTVGASSNVISGSGYGAGITNQCANWVWHDPTNTVTSLSPNPPSQMNPLNPASSQSVDVWVKVAYSFQINTCFIYYTADGSNPEGAFGMGKGTTHVVQAFYVNRDSFTNNTEWWKGTIPAQSNGTQVRYKVALFNGGSVYNGQNIQPISDAEPQGSKYYGLTQAAITNFNPTTAVVWLHNDLNTNNTRIGLQSGLHILRARVSLPRSGRSSVYNTFAQTFYYDASLPGGVIAAPTNDSYTISNQTYTIVIRADSTTTEADVNIQNTMTNNWDIYTGQHNGIGNDTNGNPIFVAAAAVTPNATLSAQYTNDPEEFHFNYPNVPSSGTGTINVRLKELTTSIYTNRYTTLTRSFSTAAPTQVIQISNPSFDGEVVTLSGGSPFAVQTCFTTNLVQNPNDFSIYINGVFQSRFNGGPTYIFGGSSCTNMHMLTYNWNNPSIGTNLIQVSYTGGVTLNDAKSVIIAPPLQITTLNSGNQFLVWSSAPNVNYQVLSTTNLTQPFVPISDIIPSQGLSTFYTDTTTNAPQKFYEIQVVQ